MSASHNRANCPFCGCLELELITEFDHFLPLSPDSALIFVECQRCFARGPRHRQDLSAVVAWGSRCSIFFDAVIQNFVEPEPKPKPQGAKP